MKHRRVLTKQQSAMILDGLYADGGCMRMGDEAGILHGGAYLGSADCEGAAIGAPLFACIVAWCFLQNRRLFGLPNRNRSKMYSTHDWVLLFERRN